MCRTDPDRGSEHEGPGVRRSGSEVLDGGPGSGDHRPAGCDHSGGRGDDLRHGSAHPRWRRAGGAAGPDSGPRGGRYRGRGRRRGQRHSPPGTGYWRPASRRAVPAATAGGQLRSVPAAAAAGSSGTSIDGVQAQYARLPFADLSTYKLPPASPTRPRCCSPTSCPPRTRSASSTARCALGDTVAVVGVGPIGLAAILTARLFSPSHIIAIDKADSRLQAAKQFGADIVATTPTRPAGTGAGGDRRAGRRRGDRGRRYSGDVRVVHHTGATRRAGGQRRRARQAGHAAPGRPVDPQHHHHHRPGRHLLHADPVDDARGRAARRRPHDHPPVRIRRLRAGLRHLRHPLAHRRPQGPAHP